MKLNIQIFKRKQREEAYKGLFLNSCVTVMKGQIVAE